MLSVNLLAVQQIALTLTRTWSIADEWHTGKQAEVFTFANVSL